MSAPKAKEPDYGNWVSMKLIYVFGVAGFLLLCLSSILLILYVSRAVGVLFLALSFEICLTSIIGAGLFIFTSLYFAYARHKFSPQGGNLQARIQELVLGRLDWDGEGQAIDVGCGNAPLTIKIAKRFPNARVTGIDYWGGAWEYSKSVCQKNAKIEGVADRVRFQKASASKLPFEDESFDAAVSNLVFHEVKDAKDKRDVIKEALRVVKKGGKFAFQDLFLDKRVYGEVNDLLEAIRSWGIKSVKFLDTSHSDFIPGALRLRFMVGAIGILYGKK
jgi:SAM-dependent methyltransferase